MDSILWQSLPVIIGIAVPTLLFLAGWIAKKLGKTLDTSHQKQLNDLLLNVTTQGISYAEQIAKKKQSENEAINGQGKLYLATQYILSQLKTYGITDIAAQELQRRIEAALGTETLLDNLQTSNLEGFLKEIKGEEDEDNFDVGE